MARATGTLPVVVEAVNTSWAAKAERGQGLAGDGGGGRSCPCLAGLQGRDRALS